MVNYKLQICSNNGTRELSISSICGKYKNELRDLDHLTKTCFDENDLKTYLYYIGLISKNELESDINIIYKNKGCTKKLPMVFIEHYHLFDRCNLISEMMFLSKKLEFLENLLDLYSSNPNLKSIMDDIRLYIGDVRINGENATIYDYTLLRTAIKDLVEKVTIIKDKVNNTDKTNYRGLRDLVVFVNRCSKIYKLKRIKDGFNSLKDYDSASIKEYEDEHKIARENGKWILSSEGDPDFPPNSEEEKMYNKLQEKLLELPIENPNFGDDEFKKRR